MRNEARAGQQIGFGEKLFLNSMPLRTRSLRVRGMNLRSSTRMSSAMITTMLGRSSGAGRASGADVAGKTPTKPLRRQIGLFAILGVVVV